MPCSPLEIIPDPFDKITKWDSGSSATFDGKKLTLSDSGLLVEQDSNSIEIPKNSFNYLKYMILGNKYLLVLDTQTTGGHAKHRVKVIDFNLWTECLIFTTSPKVPPLSEPDVKQSAGNGALFLIYYNDGNKIDHIAIHRSDDGKVVCSVISTVDPKVDIKAKATGTKLIIEYPDTSATGQGKTIQKICNRPTGICKIQPSKLPFHTAYVEGCPFTPETRDFTITNTGNDCLIVDFIDESPPFSIQQISRTLPYSLGPNENIKVTVEFDPSSPGNWNSAELHVGTTPAAGDNKALLSGSAIRAKTGIMRANVIDFGKCPLNVVTRRTLEIENTGTAPLTIDIPSLSDDGFSCTAYSGTLNCGDPPYNAEVEFSPETEGPKSADLIITSNDPGSPHKTLLKGEGCIPEAVIIPPVLRPLDFGRLQQGLRTVKLLSVRNTGDIRLTFSASVTGTGSYLFGLPDPSGSVTDMSKTRSYFADPVSPCGQGQKGSGETIVAVSFYAGDQPGLFFATLTLKGHNAANYPADQKWEFMLAAEIIPPVPLDAALVVDRSGSMSDPFGSRNKMDAAIDAGQLFLQLMRPDLDDRVAVIRYNQFPEAVLKISPVSTKTAPTKNDTIKLIKSDIPPPEGNTAIAGGTILGIKEVLSPRADVPPELTRAVVVLTDGMENTGFEDPDSPGAWYSILGGPQIDPGNMSKIIDTEPIHEYPGVKICPVGIGYDSQIDTHELAALATSSDGFFHVNRELTDELYFQLEKYYTQIFMDSIDMSAIEDPMSWIPPGGKHEIEFTILRGDVNILVVMYDWKGMRLPFYCVSPAGKVIEPAVTGGYVIRSGATELTRFVELRIPAGEPERYDKPWKAVIEHPCRICYGMPKQKMENHGFLPLDCREYKEPVLYGIAIGVVSNFRMKSFVSPQPVYVGEPISLRAVVSEAGLPVSGCDVKVEVTSPDGSKWNLKLSGEENDTDSYFSKGEYSNQFVYTCQKGTYHFHFRAEGLSSEGSPVVREALRDKPVFRLLTEGETPHKIGEEDCCRKLLEAIKAQNRVIGSIQPLKKTGTSGKKQSSGQKKKQINGEIIQNQR